MNPSARFLFPALICLFAASCQPSPPPSPAPFSPMSSTSTTFPSCADQSIKSGADFVSQKALFLSPSFDPRVMEGYRSVSLFAKEKVSGRDPYSKDMAAAWELASPLFQEYLCGLTGVFIIENACSNPPCSIGDALDYSWGFREHPPQILSTQNPGRYIALSAQLWQGIPLQAPLLGDYETRRLLYLLHWPSTSSRSSPPPPPPVFKGTEVDPNTRQMSVLAALAHGFGHVYWWDAFVQTPGGDIKPSNPTACNAAFYSNSWQNGPMIPRGRWVNFGDVSDDYHKRDDVNMVEFFQGILNRKFDTEVSDLLHAIYSGQLPNKTNADNGRWASALAAYSTDEDYVETFQLYILMTANTPLKHLPLTIYRGTGKSPYRDDVPGNLKYKPVLAWKMSCFGPLPPLPPSP
jgi:hypothetical protein